MPEDDEYFDVILIRPEPDLYAVPTDRRRCRITILDDDRPGEVSLEAVDYKCLESCGTIALKVFLSFESQPQPFSQVLRENGCAGTISVCYRTKDGSAVAPSDYTCE